MITTTMADYIINASDDTLRSIIDVAAIEQERRRKEVRDSIPWREHAQLGHKVDAIIVLRNVTPNLGLAEAKVMIEAYMEQIKVKPW